MLDVRPRCEDQIYKLTHKNRGLGAALNSKISEILDNPHHYKPLGNVLRGTRRVHVGSFVLIYEIVEPSVVRLLRFSHHDEAYE